MIGRPLLLSCAILLLTLGACGKNLSEVQLAKSCAVAADQKASFQPRVARFPLSVAVDDQFTSAERESLQAAVAEWNQLGHRLIGTDVFHMQFQAISSAVRNLSPQACGDAMGDEQHFSIVRAGDNASWSAKGFSLNEPGQTVRCYNESHETTRQIMYLYPKLIGLALLDQAVSHELGHSIGLDHSCNFNAASTADYIGCSDSKISERPGVPYYDAVMYPKLKAQTRAPVRSSGAGSLSSSSRVAAVLQSNDEQRANCIMGEP